MFFTRDWSMDVRSVFRRRQSEPVRTNPVYCRSVMTRAMLLLVLVAPAAVPAVAQVQNFKPVTREMLEKPSQS